jgi:uncharacterized membrane-anchored protein YhcB (DUF1043 family)
VISAFKSSTFRFFLIGVVLGLIMGIIMVRLFKRYHIRDTKKVLMILGSAIF